MKPMWLQEVYDLASEGKYLDAGDVIMDEMDQMFLDGNFNLANQVLPVIELEKLDTNLVTTFLCITLAARDKLPFREDFVQRAKARLQELAPDRWEKIMNRLE